MKLNHLSSLTLALILPPLTTFGQSIPDNKKETREAASNLLADGQDELSADAQELIDELNTPKAIKRLQEAQILMDEAVKNLQKADTGNKTIAIESEIIEHFYEAAKEKSQ